MSSNGGNISLQRTKYSTDVYSVKQLRKKAILEFGNSCMLGGNSDRLTVHHIIPERIFAAEKNKIIKRKKAFELNFLDNVALLSIEKHQFFNELESYFYTLSEDINAYLYFYRGKCEDYEVQDRIENIMSVAKRQIDMFSQFQSLRKEFLNMENLDNKKDYDIPTYIYKTMEILEKTYSSFYCHLSKFLNTNNNCSIDMLSVFKRLIELCEAQSKLTVQEKRLESIKIKKLELIKSDLEQREIEIYKRCCAIKYI